MYALKQNSKVNEMKGKYSNRNTNKKMDKERTAYQYTNKVRKGQT